MVIDNREIFRYAGMKQSEPDSETQKTADDIREEILSCVSPKHIIRKTAFTRTDSGIIIDGVEFCSKKLLSHLKNSESIVLFAATLGVDGDMLTKKYAHTSSVKALLTQAALAAAIESYCDEVCEKLSIDEGKNGLYLRPRFSPGYADMALTQQRYFFSVLEITKRIGVTLNDECMMIPTKSVTAFVGLTRDNDCNINNCRNCDNTDCEFRRA